MTALLLIWVSVAWMHAVAAAQPGRVVAIGDIHGAAGQFSALLETLGLTDSSQRWTGGWTTLVQTGDFTDRGAGVKIVLDLLMRLETEASAAGGRVIVLLGNHETMNLLANLQDVSPDLWASFETPRSELRREEAYDAYVAFMGARAEVLGPLLPDPLPRAAWMAAHPPGFFEYMEALGPDGTYGRWLMEKQVVARVGDSILLHGGLHPTKSPADLSELTDKARDEIATYYQKLLRDTIRSYLTKEVPFDRIRAIEKQNGIHAESDTALEGGVNSINDHLSCIHECMRIPQSNRLFNDPISMELMLNATVEWFVDHLMHVQQSKKATIEQTAEEISASSIKEID